MRRIIFLTTFLIGLSAMGAEVKDVKVLEVTTNIEHQKFQVKLGTTYRNKPTHFFVELEKEDEESFEKLSLLIKKIQEGDEFKLNLIVPSFSPFPAGSSYPGSSVKFLSHK